MRHERRHNPLEDDYLATGPLRSKAPKRKSKGDGEDDERGNGENYVDSKASRKILSLGRELAGMSALDLSWRAAALLQLPAGNNDSRTPDVPSYFG